MFLIFFNTEYMVLFNRLLNDQCFTNEPAYKLFKDVIEKMNLKVLYLMKIIKVKIRVMKIKMKMILKMKNIINQEKLNYFLEKKKTKKRNF